jgi:exodeoxyribonuclease-3
MKIIVIILALTMLHATSSAGTRAAVTIASWNVNGLRAVVKHDPELGVLKDFIQRRKVDILCLQETKLQETHVEELDKYVKEKLDLKTTKWNSSRARKGYSGTSTWVLPNSWVNDAEVKWEMNIGNEEGDLEGRSVTLLTDKFSLVNVYTPNAGEGLKRLDYRVNDWDRTITKYMQHLQTSRPEIPAILVGDLNVAHTHIDYWNAHDPRTKKQAGTSPEEQQSFGDNLLSLDGFKDSYRIKYPTRQEYSYFSARKGDRGRQAREGMRIDYVLTDADGDFFSDPFIEEGLNHPYSDHSPVGCTFHFP